ncbi:MAG TPA: aspartate kinase, partial [Opitutae bacterium]|nr:aspartate kinase [Opitutae bacterium]
MNVVVQKYGGTSVADISCIKRVARRVKKTWSAGNRVVVVVSARAGVTNELIERAKAIRKNPSDRELDMLMTCGEQETIALLAMALEALSVPAVSRTGWQAGIITDGMHSKARIREVKGGDVRKQLRAGKVVVLAGFQGVNESGDLTTFGRGGSDLSAIAMAGALKAKTCQIFTDVEGVFTADPRIVPNACKMPAINYEELLELASSGSKVMQTRAVEFAQKHNIPFEVRSSFSTKSGTQVKKKVKSLEDTLISGVAIDKNQVRVSVTELPDRPGAAAAVFKVMAEAGVVVDMIVQNVARNGKANLTFTVPSEDAFRAEKALREHLKEGAGGKLGRSTNI